MGMSLSKRMSALERNFTNLEKNFDNLVIHFTNVVGLEVKRLKEKVETPTKEKGLDVEDLLRIINSQPGKTVKISYLKTLEGMQPRMIGMLCCGTKPYCRLDGGSLTLTEHGLNFIKVDKPKEIFLDIFNKHRQRILSLKFNRSGEIYEIKGDVDYKMTCENGTDSVGITLVFEDVWKRY